MRIATWNAERLKHFQERDMKKICITAIRKACYEDLMAKYENPIKDACSITEGQVFIANGWQRPEGFCESA